MHMTRRELLEVATTSALAAAVGSRASAAAGLVQTPGRAPIFCLFSKHLPELNWADVGRAVTDAGFDGVDLTVRAGGHVLPERAGDDLPKAIEAITAQGVKVPMITTELTSAAAPSAKPILQAAARSGVRYFKTGYWRYTASPDVRAQVAATAEALAGLAALARDCGIEMGFHNHAAYIGAAIWDIAPAMDTLDQRWAGYYFDPRHAVAEGGGGSWKAATHLVMPRLKMVALKDCLWQKGPKGWTIENCPLGDGMVDWTWFSTALRNAHFAGPISVHLEYDIPGRSAEERTRRTLDAAKRDLAFARRMLKDNA
jgi:sugar phosphate isomerase/epimerase